MQLALDKFGEGDERSEGERFVPLMIWQTAPFQTWYRAQTDAGNVLQSARLLYSFRPGYKDFVFLSILKVAIYIASEDRVKENEFVVSRTDISSVLLWRKKLPLEQSEVVIVKEFRSPAATKDGFIRELVGGSSPSKDDNPREVISQETQEETGAWIEPDRFNFHMARQLMGTLASHKSHLHSVRLSEEEIDWFKAQKDVPHGKEEDTERTFVEVHTIRNILDNKVELDWATVGQILYLYCQEWEHLNED